MAGNFIISLDFELHWGGAEVWDFNVYKDYFIKTRESIPLVLQLFEDNDINATWATVGFLFAKSKEQLLKLTPIAKPTYGNAKLSSYNFFDIVGDSEGDDPFHFAPSLIEKIVKTKGQELATHTFSHFYCNEKGQTIQQFDEDLKAAQAIARENFNVTLKSLVFPRNQYNQEYLSVARENGIKVIRSNPDIWFWKDTGSCWSVLFRGIDTLLSVGKSLAFNSAFLKKDNVVKLPASRFFRPYKKKEKIIQYFKIKRILDEMTYAAKQGLSYHLWWHPHNFANDVNENLKQLKIIIEHYKYLKKSYNFQSKTMGDFE